MSGLPHCPKCNCEYTYEDRGMFVCPECAHEWTAADASAAEESGLVVRDAHGTIRLVDSDHNIDCKIPGVGQMGLKSEFVKKA